MASKILIGIALDGDSEVKRKLSEVGEAGKRSLENIGNKLAGGGRNTALADLQKQATGLRAALAPLAEASGIGGLLSGAGLGGLLGRLATGPAGIAAGLSGALFGLGKIAEGADRAKGRLASLGDAKGFERLEERAKALGTDVSNLQPRYERFVQSTQDLTAKTQTIIHPPGFQPGAVEEAAAGIRVLGGGASNSPASKENFGKFDSALLAQIRRDVPSASDAKAIADQFQQQLKTGGLTGDALRGLQGQSPSAANFLTSQLSKPLARGFANPNDLAAALDRGTVPPLDQTKVINAGAKSNPEFDKLATESRNVTQAFEGLTAASGRFLEKLGGGPAATGGIDAITKGINAVTDFKPEDALRNIQQNQTNQSPGLLPGSQFGDIFGFLKNAASNPGAIQEKTRPAVDDVSDAGHDLAAAIKDAANGVRGATPAQQKAGGGAVFGAGTSTSDSIPAMLSNKEYVINADSAAKIGLANLDYMNATGKLPGALAPEGEISRRNYKSDFVGLFGGHNFDTPGSYAKGGLIGHFATGGIMPDFSAGAAPSLNDNGAAPSGSLGHMDVNLSTNYGDFKMKATPDVARAMAAAARDAADVQTGPRPSWFGRGK